MKKDIPKIINFYRSQGEFGYLSNFYQSPFNSKGKVYMTVQHYYQSKKFEGKNMSEIIRESETPAEAFRLGRNANIPLRSDWEEVKELIMWEGLNLKFDQNPQLAKLLLETGQSKLVEHTDRDKFWGDGGNGSGKNILGIQLMRIRDNLKQK